MESNLFFLPLLAFIEGFALIISPCILPILPILLAGGVTGGKKRPYGIIFGFVLTFTLFTLTVRYIIQITGVDLDYVRYIAYFLLIIFGIIMLSDFLYNRFSSFTSSLENISHIDRKNGFWSGFLLGTLLSIIWTPCAGPILAAAIVQIAIQKSLLQSFIVLFFFALGCVIPMILIVLAGRKIISHFNFLRTHSTLLRKLLGIVIIISAIVLLLSNNLMNVASVPKTKLLSNQLPAKQLLKGVLIPYKAPEIQNISAWFNSSPLTLEQLKGKVVLIDFWTYSCINCLRALPYLKTWYEKYRKQGLVVIGVHTPEFEFEKDDTNVKKAIAKYKIIYPVALDNHFKTWLNFRNQYWPAHYLIDQSGKVVYQHFGEGDYDITENNIRYLLGLHTPVSVPYASAISSSQTPETYLGYTRSENFASPEKIVEDKVHDYHFPASLSVNKWALQGKWLIQADKIISADSNVALRMHFSARNVYSVMGSITKNPLIVKVLVDGKTVKRAGNDVRDGLLVVNEHKLYELHNSQAMTTAILELTILAPGVEIYTFTFGS